MRLKDLGRLVSNPLSDLLLQIQQFLFHLGKRRIELLYFFLGLSLTDHSAHDDRVLTQVHTSTVHGLRRKMQCPQRSSLNVACSRPY